MSDSTVIIGIGLPGSGKSTVLKPLAASRGMAYISPDDVRLELAGDTRDHSKEVQVWKTVHRRLADAIGSGGAVLDATHAKAKDRRSIAAFSREQGASNIIGYWMQTDIDTAIRRNAVRDRQVPVDVIRKMDTSLRSDPPSTDEGFDSIEKVNNAFAYFKPGDNVRLYAQLRPEGDGLAHLEEIQHTLPAEACGRLTSAGQLHMTMIHFGRIKDVFETIRRVTDISWERYSQLLAAYIQDTTGLMPEEPFLAQPAGYARFGQRGGTLVIEYTVPRRLIELQAGMYDVLRDFLTACGIRDAEAFMAGDLNFMHARVLRPHITLCKGYQGELPSAPLRPVRLQSSPTVLV